MRSYSKVLPAFVQLRWVRVTMILLAAASLGATLVATIYLTILDLEWLAFLGGVLFAAVVAMASQASKAEWAVARRGRQLERAREQLAEEMARTRNATEAMRIVDARLRLVSDALPSLILYIDRDERCRFHNRGVEEKTGLARDRIHGQLLREIIGNAVHQRIVPHLADTFAGKTVDYELAWETPGGSDSLYSARHVPYFADDPQPRGFYLLLSRVAQRAAAPAAVPAPVAEEPAGEAGGEAVAGEGGEMYLRSITDELMGWDDPRAKLTRALQQNQFLLFAQKILPIRSGAPDPLCFEILLRLQEEEDNLLPPGGFIPVAERYDMMQDLDHWVVQALISWCVEKSRAEPAWRMPLYSVNLSEATLGSPDFARFVRSELQRTNFSGRSLCFEIGEQDVINHHADVERLIAALKPAGCRFTIEGFGISKVSFSFLKGLRIDFLKIDGGITQNLLRSPSELAKLRAISTVCGKIGVRSIAEFVETKETLEKVREVGVDYVQGFGIARPGPIAGQQ